ncbi:MAG: glycosyltransferase family 4 protein [Kyrpidia sp.]|nr:glycosyltransferase family 4 protein [Kyrpidia sp.]
MRLSALVKELHRHGHEVEVVTALPNYPRGRFFPGYSGRLYMREAYLDSAVHRVWLYPAQGAGIKRMLNYGSFALLSLMGLARCKTPDYLFVNSPPLFLTIPAYLYSLWKRVPIIFNVADLWPDSVKQLGLWKEGPVLRFAESLERWTYQKATFVTAVTEGILKILVDKKGVPRENLLFLPNGVDTDLFSPRPPDREWMKKLGLDATKNMILYAGNHGFAQGLDTALRAAKKLEQESVQFVFVGDGSDKARLVRLREEMRLSNVTFLDPCSPEQVAQLYGTATAALSTLRSSPLLEGARPAKIFSAMACGKPVLYSGAGEGALLIQEAEAGMVTPPEDDEALAHAIKYLIQHHDVVERLGENGRRFVCEHYSWSVLVGRWLEQLADRTSLRQAAQSQARAGF